MNFRYLAGDLSGIQRFVLQVKSTGKAQAKRLRARSFLLELVERAALWHVEQRFDATDDDILNIAPPPAGMAGLGDATL